jgi:hypothetical protein
MHSFLEEDPMEVSRQLEAVGGLHHAAEAAVAAVAAEHGDAYRDGIKGIFDAKMMRA